MSRNLTLAIDEKLLERTREKLRAAGKTVNQEIRDHFRRIVGEDELLESDLEFLRQAAGCGNSNGQKFSREETYAERMKWPPAPAKSSADYVERG